MARRAVCFDMETGDPDDVLTLLLLVAHPRASLRCVTITPGTAEQVSLVRGLLRDCGILDRVVVGARDWPQNAENAMGLKGAFYGSLPRFSPSEGGPPVLTAVDALRNCCGEEVTLLTGAPLQNPDSALRECPEVRFGRWVAQGGFVGEGVVPPERQLQKFQGMTTCPTWNFGGAPDAAERCLKSSRIARKVLVGKNCCHDPRAAYTPELHARFMEAAASREDEIARRALQTICRAMHDLPPCLLVPANRAAESEAGAEAEATPRPSRLGSVYD
eukprot:Hpha_TRINITY_DN10948_c0_g1::TRINITY_DN10948_c0_g1_i3::g.26672::m.26672